jgi:hypothetical protein
MELKEFDSLVDKLSYAQETYDMASRAKTEAHEQLQGIKFQILEALQKSGKTKYHVDNLGTVYTIHKYTVQTPKDVEAKRRFSSWVEAKYGSDVKDSMLGINHNTLNSFVKKEIEAATERGDVAFKIPGIEDPQIIESIGFRKEK